MSENAGNSNTKRTEAQRLRTDVIPAVERARSLRWRVFVLSFIALFLELMVIRWVPSVVRLVAYYANLMLLSSFLGLGVGAMASTRKWRLLVLFPVLLAFDIGFLLLCRHVVLGGSASELRFFASNSHLLNSAVLTGIFAANAAVFVPLGQEIGYLFQAMPPLRAYAWDLSGSLCGTLIFGLFSFKHFSPMLGMAAVMMAFVGLSQWRQCLWVVPLFALTLVGVSQSNDQAALWSPYYYITIRDWQDHTSIVPDPVTNLRRMREPALYEVRVNQDSYQIDASLDISKYTPDTPAAQFVTYMREQYLLPYSLCRGRKRVLVLGSGAGNDVQAALVSGVESVEAVEIDPVLVKLSKRFSAAVPYDNPRVTVIVDDARSFLQKATPGYDLVVFGFLDSQALFSYMSNIRLDGYVYTVESMRAAYALLNENGMLSLSFFAAQDWLALKLLRMLADATGKMPIVYVSGGQIILCVFRDKPVDPPATLTRFQRGRVVELPTIAPPTDDWPYLYLREKTIPSDYLLVIGTLLALSLLAVFYVRGKGFGVNDGHFLFLGWGFLLLETKAITDCSLYFGATWFVTMIVIVGVLLMVLAANILATHIKRSSMLFYIPLFAALIVLYVVPRDWVLSLPATGSLLWVIFAVPLPIFFAGLIFSTTFRETASPSASLGSNLVGAMIGGFCEYLGMAMGHHTLALLVIGAYLASLWCRIRIGSHTALPL